MDRNEQERDYRRLEERVSRMISEGKISSESQAPIFLILLHRFYQMEDVIRESFTDGGNDCGVDAVFIEREKGDPTIHIFQSKYYTNIKNCNKCFSSDPLNKIFRFFEILKSDDLSVSKLFNPMLAQKAREIKEIHRQYIPDYKVWLVSNGAPGIEHDIQPMKRRFGFDGIDLEEFHLHDFIEFCINKGSERNQHVFHARESGFLDHGPSELKSYVGYISAVELYSVLKDLRNEKKLDFALFDMNVRGFLGFDGTVNKEIFQSASSSNKDLFSSLNNGITLIGSEVRASKRGVLPKFRVRNMNIVNGAQTCSAIFNAMKEYYPEFEQFGELSVLFKIFETTDVDLINKIAISTNTQNRVNPRDLKATDQTQVDLEKKLSKQGIRYIRKRGIEMDHNDEMISLDALKAGQIILAYSKLDPGKSKRESDTIFSDSYTEIFSGAKVEEIVRGFEIYRKIDKIREKIQENIKFKGVFRTEDTFVTYGTFHILTVFRILEEVNEDSSDDELIDKAIEIIAKVLKRVGEPAFYTFFRNAEYTKAMVEAARQDDLFEK